MKNSSVLAMAVAGVLSNAPAIASDAEVDQLKQMLQELKQDYQTRIVELEKRVAEAEAAAQQAQQTADASEQKVADVAQSKAAMKTGDNSFNPAISLVLQGSYANYSLDPEEYHIEGLPLGGEAGLRAEGMSITETEITASANVDNWFFAQTTLGLHEHEGDIELDIEEAFVDTLSLPAGFGLRFGRFYSDLGYLNAHHTHAWDFADDPLAYRAFLGGQYGDDGLRGTWVAPIDAVLLELGVETFRGDKYPGSGGEDGWGDVQNFYAKLGGDAGQNNSWQVGLARLNADPEDREAGGHGHGHEHEGEEEEIGASFSGSSDLTVLDGVWKTDLGHGRQFIVQGEYLWRDESGDVLFSEGEEQALFGYRGDQTGWYLQGIFRFQPQWRVGLRYDRLTIDNDLRMINADLDGNFASLEDDEVFEESGYEAHGDDPYRWTAMLDWTPSEFSRARLQYARDYSREEVDDQLILQYIMTLGAHGAHRF